MPIERDVSYDRRHPAVEALRGIDFRRHLLRIYAYMAGGLGVTSATAALALYSGLYARVAGTSLMWAIVLAPLPAGLILEFGLDRLSRLAAQVAYWSYATLLGLSLTILFMLAAGTGIAEAAFVCATTFLSMSLWGGATGSDLTRVAWFLTMGLCGLAIAGTVSFVLGSYGLQFAISVVAVVIFTSLMAWWTRSLKTAPDLDATWGTNG